MEQAQKKTLSQKMFGLRDTMEGEEGTWVFFRSDMTGEEKTLARQLILEQLAKNGRELWFMNPDGQPVAFGHFELDEEFWGK